MALDSVGFMKRKGGDSHTCSCAYLFLCVSFVQAVKW